MFMGRFEKRQGLSDKTKATQFAFITFIIYTALVIVSVCLVYGVHGKNIKFGETIKSIEKYNNKNININCFITNVMSKDKSFGYITNTCYKSDINNMTDYSKLSNYIPIYAKKKLELTQKVVNVRGKLEVATEENFDFVVMKDKDNNVRTLEKKQFKGKTKEKLKQEYSEIYYVFGDEYGKISPVKIKNAQICSYNSKNKKIENFNKNIENGFLTVTNNVLQQVYEKCNKNEKYKIDDEQFENLRKSIKEEGEDVLGYKGLNKLLLDIHNLVENTKKMDTSDKESINNKANSLYNSFEDYITKIELIE